MGASHGTLDLNSVLDHGRIPWNLGPKKKERESSDEKLCGHVFLLHSALLDLCLFICVLVESLVGEQSGRTIEGGYLSI